MASYIEVSTHSQTRPYQIGIGEFLNVAFNRMTGMTRHLARQIKSDRGMRIHKRQVSEKEASGGMTCPPGCYF